MKRLGKWVILSETEFRDNLWQTNEDRNKQYDTGFRAGKFHASGGYGKCLVATKAKLKEAQEQIARYKPIGEIFQPSDALVTLLQDVTGASDADAAADFEVVGQQVIRDGGTP